MALHFPSPLSACPFLLLSLSSALPMCRRPVATTNNPNTIDTTVTVTMFRHDLFSIAGTMHKVVYKSRGDHTVNSLN